MVKIRGCLRCLCRRRRSAFTKLVIGEETGRMGGIRKSSTEMEQERGGIRLKWRKIWPRVGRSGVVSRGDNTPVKSTRRGPATATRMLFQRYGETPTFRKTW